MLPNRRKLKRQSRHRTVVAGYQQRIFSYEKAVCCVAFTGGLFGTDTENFTLDAVGNRIAHSKVTGAWVYDANNRLTQRGTGANATTYQYDDAGNLTQKTEPGNKTTQYSYDTQNRLIEVSNTSNAQASLQSKLVARYGYDPLDRRIRKEQYKSADGQALAQPLRTYYLYADEGLIAESTQAITLNADGSVTAGAAPQITTQYGPGPNSEFTTGVLFVKTSNSNSNSNNQQSFAYLHHDHLQTPLQATDKAGNVVWAASYNAFGKAAITTPTASANNPTINLNLRLPGQYLDEETGLHYNYRRYYDTESGRYFTQDPIGLEGGINRFAYTAHDPLNAIDPTGEMGGGGNHAGGKAFMLPSLPQGVVDFAAGMGDTILFGQGQRLRDVLAIDGGVDQCSNAYSNGEWAGIAASVATGFAGGVKAAGVKGAGKEFSHWIPNRMGGPRSIFNGNYVSSATHALSDPYRYRFMKAAWKMENPMPNQAVQQWIRIPDVYKGTAAGGAYGAMTPSKKGCTCRL